MTRRTAGLRVLEPRTTSNRRGWPYGACLAAVMFTLAGWAATDAAVSQPATLQPPPKEAAGKQPAAPDKDPKQKAPAKKAPAKADPEETEQTPAEGGPEHRYLTLEYRAHQRAREFVDTAILREVVPRGYALEEEETVRSAAGTERTIWRFTKQVDAKTGRSLGLVFSPFPGGGFELYLFGEEAVAGKPGAGENPDLAKVQAGFDKLKEDLEGSVLGGPHDQLLEYPLSYVQADRAVAILRSLGYPVIEYKQADLGNKKSPIDPDRVFNEAVARKSLSRPAIINLIDSALTTLVSGGSGPGGTSSEAGGTTLSGGQTLPSVTSAVPQQRLLIVYDGRDRQSLDELLVRLQQDIDVAARQILIEALVIEVDHDRLTEIGFSFSGSKDNSEVSFEEQGGVTQPFTWVWKRPAAETFLRFMGSLRALADRGEATVLSRPSVLVLDGRQARIKVADEVPFTASIEQTPSGFTTVATKFLTAGIVLNLRPRSTFDRSEVSMQVETIISSAEPSRVLPNTGIVVAPKVQSREVQTLVRVANDTPFVIGGLLALTESDQQTGIPRAMRWKWLGRLFRKDNVVRDRKEVIVVITPHIVPEDDRSFSYTIPRDAKIFDSFGTTLFRNVYRLRTSDIFDHSFVSESEEYKDAVALARQLGKTLSGAPFETVPDVGREKVVRDVEKRLTGIVSKEAIQTFLALFEEDVPAEEILVHRMMIQLLEKELLDEESAWQLGREAPLSFDEYVPIEKLLVIGSGGKEAAEAEYDLEFLVENKAYRRCGTAEDGRYLRIAFPEPDTAQIAPPAADIDCLGPDDEQGQDQDQGQLQKEQLTKDALEAKLEEEEKKEPLDQDNLIKKLKKDYENETPAIYLSRRRIGRRKPAGDPYAPRQTPEQLLQSVLALERLLELNPKESLPRTLEGFHAGREIVFPTREDLQGRTYVLSRDTAKRFYETLDFYAAFKSQYDERLKELREGLDQVALRQAIGLWFEGWNGWREGKAGFYTEAYLEPPKTAPDPPPDRLVETATLPPLDDGSAGSKRLRVQLAYLSRDSCEIESRELLFVKPGDSWKIEKEEAGARKPCPAALRDELTADLPPPGPDLTEVRSVLRAWKNAWEAQDVDAYLALYSSRFRPASGESRWTWSVDRRGKLTRPARIRLAIDALDLEPESPERVVARFVQTYDSNLLCDIEHKTLLLRREEAGWKITAESTAPGKRRLCRRKGGTRRAAS